MPTFSQLKELIEAAEHEFGTMSELISMMKTPGGHLNNFGDDFVMLCRKHGIQQALVARAVGVTPPAISKRYKRNIKKGSFFYTRPTDTERQNVQDQTISRKPPAARA